MIYFILILFENEYLSFRLWDMTSRNLIARAHFDLNVRSAAFSPDGAHIAVGHGDGSFRVLKGRFVNHMRS